MSQFEYTKNGIRLARYRDDPGAGFLFMWEFWVGFGVFYVAAIFLPWTWLARTGLFDWFVDFMGSFIMSVKHLPTDVRYRPRAGSELQLGFVHFVLMMFTIIKLIRQKPHPGFRRLSTWRLVYLLSGVCAIMPILVWIVLFWHGQGETLDNPNELLHGNKYQVILSYTVMWFAPLGFLTLGKAGAYELLRRTLKTNRD